MIKRLYREYCETESAWVEKTTEDEVLSDEYVCPNDAGHTVRDNSLVLENEAYEQLGMNSANGLQLANGADGGKVNITADRLEIEGVVFTNVSLVADLNVLGANGRDAGSEANDTPYAVWAASEEKGNPDSLISLLSLSGTAPALPGNETNKFRVGWIFNDAAGHIHSFINNPGDDWFWWYENRNLADFKKAYTMADTNWHLTTAGIWAGTTIRHVLWAVRHVKNSNAQPGWDVKPTGLTTGDEENLVLRYTSSDLAAGQYEVPVDANGQHEYRFVGSGTLDSTASTNELAYRDCRT